MKCRENNTSNYYGGYGGCGTHRNNNLINIIKRYGK